MTGQGIIRPWHIYRNRLLRHIRQIRHRPHIIAIPCVFKPFLCISQQRQADTGHFTKPPVRIPCALPNSTPMVRFCKLHFPVSILLLDVRQHRPHLRGFCQRLRLPPVSLSRFYRLGRREILLPEKIRRFRRVEDQRNDLVPVLIVGHHRFRIPDVDLPRKHRRGHCHAYGRRHRDQKRSFHEHSSL